jgi:uncharacterized protein YcnI
MQASKRALLSVGVLVALGWAIPSLAACSRSTGCKSCGYFVEVGGWKCATVAWDAYCTCTNISNGCDLGTSACDYTGPNCPGTFCEEYQGSANQTMLLRESQGGKTAMTANSQPVDDSARIEMIEVEAISSDPSGLLMKKADHLP